MFWYYVFRLFGWRWVLRINNIFKFFEFSVKILEFDVLIVNIVLLGEKVVDFIFCYGVCNV